MSYQRLKQFPHCDILDMFFNALNYKLEPHCICVTLKKKKNSSLRGQDPRTASYFKMNTLILYALQASNGRAQYADGRRFDPHVRQHFLLWKLVMK